MAKAEAEVKISFLKAHEILFQVFHINRTFGLSWYGYLNFAFMYMSEKQINEKQV